jgi:hypothetical protein
MRRLFISLLCCVLASLSCKADAQVGIFIRPNSSSLTSPVQGQTYLFNSTNNTINAYNGSSFFAISAPKNNFTATVAPTTSNDNTQGYTPGSAWYNTVTGFTYQLVDATTSAAVWIQTNNLGSLSIPLTSLLPGGAATGQSLLFNGTHWAPGNPLISLNNVLQTGALIGQVPVWNGSNWIPNSVPATSSGLTVSPQDTNFTAAPNVLYLVTLDTGNVTATLPDATLCSGQQIVVVLNIGSSINYVLNFATTSGQFINNTDNNYFSVGFNGATAVTTNTFLSNGTNWSCNQSGDMLAGLFQGPFNGTDTGSIVTCTGLNTLQLAPILQANSINSDTTIFGTNSYFVDTSGGDVNITMPDATGESGQFCTVVLTVTGNNVNFLTVGGQNINGNPPSSLTPLSTNPGDSYSFVSDGSNWWTMVQP